MEYLPADEIFHYNADTLISLRKLYNLDKPGQMDEAIDLLDSWIQKQNHFVKKDFPRDYLERVIIQLKGSVERAKSQIEKICTLRTLLPKFFERCDMMMDYADLQEYCAITFLPKLTNDHHRIMIYKYKSVQITHKMILKVFTSSILYCEYIKRHDYCNGLIGIADFRDFNILDFVAQMNLMEMKQILTIFFGGYSMRLQQFFCISNSKAIDVFIKIYKQMVSEKLGSRVQVLTSNEELQKYVQKELLPSDYGGDQDSIDSLTGKIKEVMGSKENVEYFKNMSQAGTIESLRVKSNYSADFSELAGTFRKLDFD